MFAPKTIHEVILALDEIIEACKSQQNTAAYFAWLYRKVTIRIRDGIQQGEFEDNARMEQLDIQFAKRYLDAFTAYTSGKQCSDCWLAAFEQTRLPQGIILQHILAGINAHINLDLGIAAYETAGNQPLVSLQADFNAINQILASMVEEVQQKIAKVSPVCKWLLPLAGSLDDFLIRFSIDTAREGAWSFAMALNQSSSRPNLIRQRDQRIGQLGKTLFRPGVRLRILLKIIRLFEWRTVSENIRLLHNGL